MDRVAVAVSSPDLDAFVEAHFGRAAYLVLVDPQSMEWEAVENPGRRAGGGAGIQAAQLLGQHQVVAVVSGDFGPNAHEALRIAGIAMYRGDPSITARGALERLARGGLSRIRTPPAEGGIRHGGGRGGGHRGTGGGGSQRS